MEKRTILLVEDDAVVRDMVKSALEREYNVLEASNCSEALASLRNHFDLALIDYDLPDGDGFDVLKRIREMKSALPVIFMTAYSTENLAITAFRKGVTDYIRKPLSFVYLLGKLSELFEGKSNGDHQESVESRTVFVMDSLALYIDEHYKEDLTLEQMIRMTSLNRNTFCVAFRNRFGRTFKSYLNGVRVKNAAELLKSSDLTVTQIAHFVGYTNIVHFERVFRTVHGMAPITYKKTRTRNL